MRWEGGSKLFTVVYGAGLAAGGCSKLLIAMCSEALGVVDVELLEAMNGNSLLSLEGNIGLDSVGGKGDGGQALLEGEMMEEWGSWRDGGRRLKTKNPNDELI